MRRLPWLVAWLLLWAPPGLLGGCGRLGFDATTSAADTATDSGIDTSTDAPSDTGPNQRDVGSPVDAAPDTALSADATPGDTDLAPDGESTTDATVPTEAEAPDASAEGGAVDSALPDSAGPETSNFDVVEAAPMDTAPPTYAVGGVVMGLMGTGLVLQDNGSGNLAVTMNGYFTFSAPVASGLPYDVTILAQPSGQSCTVSAGVGTVGAGPVTGVVVDCLSGSFVVGGTVQGLAAGEPVELEDNAGDAIFVSQNGSFAFPTPVADGAMYDVTVQANPATPVDQTCAVMMGSGTISGSNVSSVVVKCTDQSFTVSGTVSGLMSPTMITLADNGGDNLTVGNGPFMFATPVPSGQSYAVTVPSSSGYTCTVAGAAGMVTNANVTNVAVTCQQEAIFLYTGSDQMFVVPAGVSSLVVKLWGAAGGSSGATAGGGGFVMNGSLPVTPGAVLTVVVGGGGSIQIGANPETYGGGGAGSSQPMYAWTGAGGGRSAIRGGSGDIMTAGGGGGTGYSGQTGIGGSGCAGADGAGGDATGPAPGQGGQLMGGGAAGNQSSATPGSPGALYQGGDGANDWQGLNVGAGGGGGYYGGGGGGGTDNSQSGAGGGGSCYGPMGTTFDGTGGTSDPDYQGNAGRPTSGAGNPGLVVIRW